MRLATPATIRYARRAGSALSGAGCGGPVPHRDPEKSKEAIRKWRAANRERIREAGQKWRAANLDKARQMARAYREANLEQVRARQRKYAAAKRARAKERGGTPGSEPS
jgi:hypothetical protein